MADCVRCGHPESDHQAGVDAGLSPIIGCRVVTECDDDGPRLCPCPDFVERAGWATRTLVRMLSRG